MRSPAEMKVIPIDITNACHFRCSNCTRFCGHHPRVTFMEFDVFRRIVDSMKGFPGIVGIIGGEPTLHPEFERLVEYYAQHIEEPRPRSFFRLPVRDFTLYSRVLKYQRGRHRGLFTSLGNRYYEHFELIQDVFPYQSINDHASTCMHQALMITRKELGIPDAEWVKLRDACWLQNVWSAGVTHKGAFFCEMAAMFDLLFDGPGGWPIEPGWWRRKPGDFGDQLSWCEWCSAALKVPRMDGHQERDIVSPVMLERLKAIGSPRVRKGKFVVFDPAGYDASKYTGNKDDPIWYLPKERGDAARVSSTNATLRPRKVSVLVLAGRERIPFATDGLEFLTREQYEARGFRDWVAVVRDGAALRSGFVESLKGCVLNPGCLYFHSPSQGFLGRRRVDPGHVARHAEVMLLNRRARALRGAERLPMGRDLVARFERRKRVHMDGYPDMGALGLWQRVMLRWDQVKHRMAFVWPNVRLRPWPLSWL